MLRDEVDQGAKLGVIGLLQQSDLQASEFKINFNSKRQNIKSKVEILKELLQNKIQKKRQKKQQNEVGLTKVGITKLKKSYAKQIR